jgi:hypothetical protein
LLFNPGVLLTGIKNVVISDLNIWDLYGTKQSTPIQIRIFYVNYFTFYAQHVYYIQKSLNPVGVSSLKNLNNSRLPNYISYLLKYAPAFSL